MYKDEMCTKGQWNTYTLELKAPAHEKYKSQILEYHVKKDGNDFMSGSYDISGAYADGPLYFYVSDAWYEVGSTVLVKNFFYCFD